MEDLKPRLQQEREEAQAEIERLDQLLQERGEYGFGKGDPAVYQWEFNLALREQYQQRVEQIDKALRRVEEGSYGICQECAQAIEPERLEALPLTSLCIKCARSKG